MQKTTSRNGHREITAIVQQRAAQFYTDFSLQTAACWKRQDECGESEPKLPPAANAETKCDNKVEVKKSQKVSKLYAKCANLSFQEKSSVNPFKNERESPRSKNSVSSLHHLLLKTSSFAIVSYSHDFGSSICLNQIIHQNKLEVKELCLT